MEIDIRKLITEEILKKKMCFVIFDYIDKEMYFQSNETFDSREQYNPLTFNFKILKNIPSNEKQTNKTN